jgi:hypothetical protein
MTKKRKWEFELLIVLALTTLFMILSHYVSFFMGLFMVIGSWVSSIWIVDYVLRRVNEVLR